MTHPDARTLAPAAQMEKRRIAMTMREQGDSFSAIGLALGVHYMTVSMWWDRYQAGGLEALAVRTRGPKVGVHRRLTARQEQSVQKAITDTTPDQLKLPFALWTRAAIAQLIQRRFNIVLPVRTMGHYLSRWGFTAQKPLKRAYEQRPEAIAAWLKPSETPAAACRTSAGCARRTSPECPTAFPGPDPSGRPAFRRAGSAPPVRARP